MVNLLRVTASILLTITIICTLIVTWVISAIPLWLGLVIIGIVCIIVIIMFALSEIIERQEVLFKEIREQNSILHRLEKSR